MRIVHGDGVGKVSGALTGLPGSSIRDVTGADPSVASIKGTDVVFDVPASSGVVGIDFNIGFYSQATEVRVNGSAGPLATDLLLFGQKAVPATSNPVTLHKN